MLKIGSRVSFIEDDVVYTGIIGAYCDDGYAVVVLDLDNIPPITAWELKYSDWLEVIVDNIGAKYIECLCYYVQESKIKGDDSMSNKFTVGAKVVAAKDSPKGLYNFGDIGEVKKFRDDVASVGVQLAKKRDGLTTWFRPENLLDINDYENVVELTEDLIEDRGVEKTYKFFSLTTLRNKGFEFDTNGDLVNETFILTGKELNMIDAVVSGIEYDEYILINDVEYTKDYLGMVFMEKKER